MTIRVGAFILSSLLGITSSLQAVATCEESGIAVQRAGFASAIIDREPQWITDLTTHDRLTFFTEVEAERPPAALVHRWFSGDTEIAAVTLPIGAKRWRTWSSKNVAPFDVASLAVSIETADGCRLQWSALDSGSSGGSLAAALASRDSIGARIAANQRLQTTPGDTVAQHALDFTIPLMEMEAALNEGRLYSLADQLDSLQKRATNADENARLSKLRAKYETLVQEKQRNREKFVKTFSDYAEQTRLLGDVIYSDNWPQHQQRLSLPLFDDFALLETTTGDDGEPSYVFEQISLGEVFAVP